MSHILIRFLISLLFISFIYSIEFEKWIQNTKKLIFDKNEIIRISFKAKIKSNNIDYPFASYKKKKEFKGSKIFIQKNFSKNFIIKKFVQ